MIKKPQDLNITKVENLRGGKNTATITHIIQGDELKDQAKMFSIISLPPGGSIGYHDHTNDFEVYYILKGEGVVDDSGKIVHVSKGDTIYTANGATHSIENTGDEDLEFIAVVILT